MATLEKRVQVLFDQKDYALVAGEARALGVSVGAFIREAVNERVSAARANALASWQELWDIADAAPASGPLDWERMNADYEDEMDPAWRLSRNAPGGLRDDA